MTRVILISKAYVSRTHFLDACIMFVSQWYTPGYMPISYSLWLSQSGICGRQRPKKWTKEGSYSRRPLPSFPNPPSLFPFLPIPYPFHARYAGYSFVPWGTPAGIYRHSEKQSWASLTLYLLYNRKSTIQLKMWFGIYRNLRIDALIYCDQWDPTPYGNQIKLL